MVLSKVVEKLRLYSFFLFILPTIAIVGSLLFHNTLLGLDDLIEHKDYNKINLDDIPGSEFQLICTENNNFCTNKNPIAQITERADRIDKCFANNVENEFKHDGIKIEQQLLFDKVNENVVLNKKYLDGEIKYIILVKNEKNKSCIKNKKIHYFIYKYLPFYSTVLNVLGQKFVDAQVTLGTSHTVNPFLYGEVSISNIVKRFPINYFFKPFMYFGVILMLLYWFNYNQSFKIITIKKNNIFYYLGIGSALCLFIHVFFLGSTSNNEILKDIRRAVLMLFILLEVLAQIFLVSALYKNKDYFYKYINSFVMKIKIIFVSIISIATVLIISVLMTFDAERYIHNIIEWNYFIILLLFYYLSSLLWKKNI